MVFSYKIELKAARGKLADNKAEKPRFIYLKPLIKMEFWQDKYPHDRSEYTTAVQDTWAFFIMFIGFYECTVWNA